jgi:hypothetical protein
MVPLSDATFARAQSHAVPLVDDLESVINRAFDALEKIEKKEVQASALGNEAQAIQPYNPESPPNLAFSQPVAIKVDGEDVPYGQLYWNNLMIKVIGKAVAAGHTGESLRALMVVPTILGLKESQGFKFLADAGISVQGQDANAAWKQTMHLAGHLGLKLEVIWKWQLNEKASLPGQKGSFTVG